MSEPVNIVKSAFNWRFVLKLVAGYVVFSAVLEVAAMFGYPQLQAFVERPVSTIRGLIGK